MSAFMVGDEHINLLVKAASCWDVYMQYSGPGGAVKVKDLPGMAGELLHRANADSIVARYGEDTGMGEDGEYSGYKGSQYMSLEPVAILKACQCFDYQACEVNDYRETNAAKLVDQIRREAIQRLPGYEDAQWNYSIPSRKMQAA